MSSTGKRKRTDEQKRLTFGDSGARPTNAFLHRLIDAHEEAISGFVVERQALLMRLAKAERDRDHYKKIAETCLFIQSDEDTDDGKSE